MGLHRLLLGVVVVLFVGALVGVALLWPTGGPDGAEPEEFAADVSLVDGRIIDVRDIDDDDAAGLVPGATLVALTVSLDTGEVVTFEQIDDTGELFAPGQDVRLQAVDAPEGGETSYVVSDFRRGVPLVLLALLFVVVVVGFSRWQGVRALIGLVLTFGVIIGFIVPAIFGGRSPVAVALVGAVLIMIITLYFAHGFSAKTTAAVCGTAGALLLTAVLAVVFVTAGDITGFTSEEARLANVEVGGLSLQGLLLAGVMIGALGVLDDVTMSQASTVFELHRADPSAGFSELLRSALTVGRDHIAATVNTLFLAYAGAALPLLLLFVVSPDPFGTIVTSEIVAVEVVRTLVGSLGLIAAVPLTTALAAAVVLGSGGAGARASAPRPRRQPARRARRPGDDRGKRRAADAAAAGPRASARVRPVPPGQGGAEPSGPADPDPWEGPDPWDEPGPWQEPPGRAEPAPRSQPSVPRASGGEDLAELDDEEWVQRLRGFYRLPPGSDDQPGRRR